MNLYIRLHNGEPVEHPLSESNLLQVWQVSEITDELLEEKGFARFVRPNLDPGIQVVAENGYELGEDGIVKPILETRELTQEEKVDLWVRRPRNFALANTDWTQMPDSPLSAAKKAEWAAYRQELRDMTDVYADIQDPNDIVPPTMPSN